jgi:preprotein translocase subunit SecE
MKAPKGFLKNPFKWSDMANQIVQFFKEAKAELLKVNWPNRQQTINYTLMVVGISIAIALFLGGLDYIFGYILKTYLVK